MVGKMVVGQDAMSSMFIYDYHFSIIISKFITRAKSVNCYWFLLQKMQMTVNRILLLSRRRQPIIMWIVPLLNRLYHYKDFANANSKINITLNLNGNVIPEEFATIVSVMCVAAVLFKSTWWSECSLLACSRYRFNYMPY